MSLRKRRSDIAGLVHDLSLVMRAGADDHQLGDLVAAGDRTMQALASQDAPLRASLKVLPATLSGARETLTNLDPFARKLRNTLTELTPAVRQLPATLASLRSFSNTTSGALRHAIRESRS